MEVTPSIRLTRALAAGGMGSVWVGHHSGLQTNVAVKFVSADLSSSEGALHRFSDEAAAAAQIKSPHVVQVHDHGVLADELPFIVMELLDGENLASRIEREGPMQMAAAAVLVQQLGQVLDKAHQAGIVHRDVKPENVFLVEGYGELFLKLIDFGIAKRLVGDSSVTAVGSIMGTPDFICPEQMLNAKDVGPAADLWSFAAVVYYALVGVAPFHQDSVAGTLLAIARGEFALPFARYGIGSQRLDAFFTRALARQATARFASASEFVAAFCDCVEMRGTRTLRSQFVSTEDQETTLEIAAGSGAWLSHTPASTRPDIVRGDGARGSTLPSPVAFGSDAPPTSSIFLREPRPLAEPSPLEDSARRPVTWTTADTSVVVVEADTGRMRRGVAVFAALAMSIVGAAWVVYGWSPPQVTELGAPVQSIGRFLDSHVERRIPEALAGSLPSAPAAPPKPSTAPPLVLGQTLPLLETPLADVPEEQRRASASTSASRETHEFDEELVEPWQTTEPAALQVPARARARSSSGSRTQLKSKDRGF